MSTYVPNPLGDHASAFEDTGSLDDTGVKILSEHVTIDNPAEVGASAKPGTGGTGTAAASAAAIGSSLACLSVLLQNTHATLTLKFGNATAQPTILNPGAIASIPATNVTDVWVIDGSGHATFSYLPIVEA